MTVLSPAARHALLLSAILAAVWIAAATIRPSSTFHLAPILITLGGVLLAAESERGQPGWWIVVVAGAAALSLATTGILAVSGWLLGPSLLPFGGAAVEAVVFTLGSAAAGAAMGLSARLTSV